MDFNLSDEQRSWQQVARKFAEEELRPKSLERDAIPNAVDTFDWEIIKKGSKLGLRTLAVPKEMAVRHGFPATVPSATPATMATASVSRPRRPSSDGTPPQGLERAVVDLCALLRQLRAGHRQVA